jgi:hypothetical protein
MEVRRRSDRQIRHHHARYAQRRAHRGEGPGREAQAGHCAVEPFEEATDKYGIITPGVRNGALSEVKGLVEKPQRGTAPSNLAVIGRYILQPEVMRVLEKQGKGAGGEIQLTDAMAQMIGGQRFHGVTFEGTRYDCGDKAGLHPGEHRGGAGARGHRPGDSRFHGEPLHPAEPRKVTKVTTFTREGCDLPRCAGTRDISDAKERLGHRPRAR